MVVASSACATSVSGPEEVELVVLVDDRGRPTGTMPKSEVHGTDTPLHLAFSVYVFHSDGRFLVTRRAVSKRTWPGVWTNTCCGHPRPGEAPAVAARRRLWQELSLVPLTLDLVLGDFSYHAISPEGIVENELCPVFVATVDADPDPDPAEVVQWGWVSWESFRELTRSSPWAVSPWSVLQVQALPAGRLTPTAGHR
jgi:isopentenyl-diphosphate delta-isomerase